jgi:DNA-directed RNA polymerase specialized sigma24 family protein
VFNPFAEIVDDSEDIDLVERAKAGSREALEKLILRHQAWIYNIAVRMVFQPQDAEEVTQEVLIKAITHLDAFQGNSQFRTWLYRIAANHVLNMKRRDAESQVHTFRFWRPAMSALSTASIPKG